MAKAFFRNVTDQITGTNGKATDIHIAEAIVRFNDDHLKLIKFKREFDKYTQAILIFDNASHRFFDYIRSLTDSSWTQKPSFVQSCIDMGRIRNEHLQQLNRDINSDIDLSFDIFEKMKIRFEEQNRVQNDYDKIRKQYRSSIKRDEQLKSDRIKNELDQLQSALNLLNSELRHDLPQFQFDLQNHYVKTILDLFEIDGKYYENFEKLCSRSVQNLKRDHSTEPNGNEYDTIKEVRSTTVGLNKKVPYSTPSSQNKPTDYRILHQARVIHDYKAENEDEIDLIKDEYISVISFQDDEDDEHDKGWEYGEKSDGTIGLFPVNFTVRLYDNEKKQ